MDEKLSRRLEQLRQNLAGQEDKGFQLFEELFQDYWPDRLPQCQQLVTIAKEHSFQTQLYTQWLDYYDGLLHNEYHRAWDKAERIFSRLLEKNPPDDLKGKTHNALAMSYDYQAHWDLALEHLQQALVVSQDLEDRLFAGRILTNMGIVHTRGFMFSFEGFTHKHLLQAETCHQQAIQIAQDLEDHALESWAWNNLGATYKELHRWEEALGCYQRDRVICEELNDRYGVGLSANNLGEIYQRLGQPAKAEAAYQQALEIMQECNDQYEKADVLANLASLYHQQAKLTAASKVYDRSIQAIESIRLNISSQVARMGFFDTEAHIYGGKVLLSLELGKVREAFDNVERAKSRSFIELLANRSIRATRRVPADLVTEEQDLRTQLAKLYRASTASPDKIAALEKQLAQVRRRIQLADAEYASFNIVAPLTYQTVQKRLPPDAVLLEYYTTDDRAVAFIITQDRVDAKLLDISPADLQQKAFDNARQLKRLSPGPHGRLHDPWILGRLYDFLIAPLRDVLQDKRILYLVPHGVLHYIPFHALYYEPDGARRYLVQDYEQIIYAPSATVLLEHCRSKARSEQESCLVLGYGRDLQYAENEARRVAGISKGRLYLGEQAKREVVYNEGGQYRFLHFSCHGFFNPRLPLASGLSLADGFLDATDILQHVELNADLVTLSACETGLSKITKGDELIGLARAFIYAGTPSVLVSLWKVDELSTQILMERFYSELLTGVENNISAAEALRRAQLYLINLSTAERLFSHPYFWASFFLMGGHV